MRVYIVSAFMGAILGVFGGYLYARANEDQIAKYGDVEPIKPFDLLLIAGSLLGLFRQITELSGKKK
jgi:hypothetical protein